MSKLIPQYFIDDLLTKVDIVDVVGSRVKLRRAGSNMLGLCPFHTEKTPSFTVSPNKQFFHCFGCNAHGSAIGFLMQFERLTFIEAVENLASYIGLDVPKASGHADKSTYSDLYELTEKVAAFFEKQLRSAPKAIDYLKTRGLTGTISKHFRIGYAPNNWDNLKSIHNDNPAIKQLLISSGMLINKDSKTYARFRDRIMFPIRNSRGHIIAFGGRTISNEPPKYLNSPETVIFHKGEELYGLHEARKALNKIQSIIVVEGYLDVVALSQFDIPNVVATLGTAISTKHIQLLLRHTSEIIFCFDGDPAGRAAAWRALENSLPIMRDGIQIKFLFLPEEHDPDSLVRKEGKSGFLRLLDTAITLSDFFIKQLTSNTNIASLDGKARLMNTAQDLLVKMPNSIFRQLLLSRLADLIGINPEELTNQKLQKIPHELKREEALDSKSGGKIINIIPPLQKAISILLHHPQLAIEIDSIDITVTDQLSGLDILVRLIDLLKGQQKMAIGAVLEHWRDQQEFEVLSELACKEPIIPKDILKNELSGIINLLIQLQREYAIKMLLAKAGNNEISADEKKILQNLIESSKK